MFLSRVISMGIGAMLRLTVSYLKYIFVDGTFIDVDADTPFSTAIDNIFPVSGREASFPVASPMKKPASQSQPSLGLFRLTAYLRLASCFSTPGWMCIGIEYRQAAVAVPFPRHISALSLFLSFPTSRFFLSFPPCPYISATSSASPSSKSSASSYESCDLIDQIAFLLLSFFPLARFLARSLPSLFFFFFFLFFFTLFLLLVQISNFCLALYPMSSDVVITVVVAVYPTI